MICHLNTTKNRNRKKNQSESSEKTRLNESVFLFEARVEQTMHPSLAERMARQRGTALGFIVKTNVRPGDYYDNNFDTKFCKF